MSRKKKDRVSFYPAQWFSLIATVAEGQVITVPVANMKAARSLRWRFYDLRVLLRVDETRQKEALMADSIIATIEKAVGDSALVVFTPRDITVEANQLERALSEQTSPKASKKAPVSTTEIRKFLEEE